MRLITSGQSRELDRQAQQLGVPGVVLMEAAACKAAAVARRMMADKPLRRTLILAGRGNNGGDGLAMARHLRNAGFPVKVYLCGHAAGLPPEAAANLAAWTGSGGHCAVAADCPSFWDDLQLDLGSWADLAVDALLGTGQTTPPAGDVGRAAGMLSARGAGPPLVLALDVPTGLDADTGRLFEPHVRANATVTFGLPKVGLFAMPGAEAAGDVYVADIGLPGVNRSLPIRRGETRLFTSAEGRALLGASRPRAAHKGDAGAVLLIGGSVGMTGAAVLMAEAAVLGGAGLVTLAVPAAVQPVVASALREAMTYPLPCGHSGALRVAEAVDAALALAAACDAVALGPGMGRGPETVEFVRSFVRACPVPLVLDADGLNAFEGLAGLLAGRPSCPDGRQQGAAPAAPPGSPAPVPLVLTPHPGELARLTGMTVSEIQSDRIAAARLAAAQTAATCLLKGAGTVVASPDGTAFLISAGNPGMASGGMGDVLTGLVGALLAQSLTTAARAHRAHGAHAGQPPGAACLDARPEDLCLHAGAAGALLHAVAGDLAALEIGGVGIRAGDVAERLPRARRLVSGAGAVPARLETSLLGVKDFV